MDAAMIALTTQGIAQRLAVSYKIRRDSGRSDSDFGGWEPWPGCRTNLEEHFENIVVSHRVYGKQSGQLHEETNYGTVRNPYTGQLLQARRKSVFDGLSQKELSEVADPVVKKALIDNLHERGLNPTESKSKLKFDRTTPPLMPDGQVIKKVRLHKNLPGNRVLRPTTDPLTSVTLSRNQAAWVYRNPRTGRMRIHVETRLDAFLSRNVSPAEKRTRFQREGEEFVWSVRPGDTLVARPGGQDRTIAWRVDGFDDSGSRILCRLSHTADSSEAAAKVSARTLAQDSWTKIAVTPDGEVRRARD